MAVFRFSAVKGALCVAPETGLLPKNYREESLCEYGPNQALTASNLRQHLDQQIDEFMNGGVNIGPIAILIHGNDFNPLDKNTNSFHSTNPHICVYNNRGYSWKRSIRQNRFSWPSSLHLDLDAIEETHGMAIAFGWTSNGKFRQLFSDYYLEAERSALDSAYALAQIYIALTDLIPEAPLHFFIHGMGSDVFFEMLRIVRQDQEHWQLCPRIHTVQLLGSLTKSAEASEIYHAIENDFTQENRPYFFNFMHSEDDLVNLRKEHYRFEKMKISLLGVDGLEEKKALHWMDIDLNSSKVRSWLRRKLLMDIKVRDPENIRDHQFYYKYLPNMSLFRNILWEKEPFTFPKLRKLGLPEGKKSWWRPILETLLGLDD